MTKRQGNNRKPTGWNRSLGNQLFNERNRALLKHKIDKSNAPHQSHRTTATHSIEMGIATKVDSVTDETGLEEFLAKTELAEASFAASKEDARIVELTVTQSATVVQTDSVDILKTKFAECLKIPRRPDKHLYSTSEELKKLENFTFLEWRERLAKLQDRNGVLLTPFERNLELWRQLWRVIERSDIVMQIVDARNPLLFLNPDLEAYIKESGISKQTICLMNKVDLLTEEQIDMWRKWLIENHVDTVFWSSLDDADMSLSEPEDDKAIGSHKSEKESGKIELNAKDMMNSSANTAQQKQLIPLFRHSSELIAYLKSRGRTSVGAPLVVGMVGYPNVGKSSTINKLLGRKKVPVSATPGKTRHFQTLLIDSELTLYDCPGLVMPSFALNTSEMLLSGILPIDHAHDYLAPIAVLASRVPHAYIEGLYSVMLTDFIDECGNLSAQNLLTAVAFVRGYMTEAGGADCSRAARLLLKDVVSGRLKWIAAPPGIDQKDFDKYTYQLSDATAVRGKKCNLMQQLEKRKLIEDVSTKNKKFDEQFFSEPRNEFHIRGRVTHPMTTSNLMSKSSKKHFNKDKREKLRRIYGD